jgi:hypothetical protein
MQRIIDSYRHANSLPTRVELSDCTHARRASVEDYVRDSFRRFYAAEVRQFMPVLMGLRDDAGQILGALGLRAAAAEPLFLEHYLDRPIEQTLSASTGRPVDRTAIMEVGNLAVSASGGSYWLIAALTAYLHALGVQWVVFTIGPYLRNAFARLGLSPIDLGPAHADRLPPAERGAWGSYYRQRPRVMAGEVACGYRALLQIAGPGSPAQQLLNHAGQAAVLAA